MPKLIDIFVYVIGIFWGDVLQSSFLYSLSRIGSTNVVRLPADSEVWCCLGKLLLQNTLVSALNKGVSTREDD